MSFVNGHFRSFSKTSVSLTELCPALVVPINMGIKRQIWIRLLRISVVFYLIPIVRIKLCLLKNILCNPWKTFMQFYKRCIWCSVRLLYFWKRNNFAVFVIEFLILLILICDQNINKPFFKSTRRTYLRITTRRHSFQHYSGRTL